VAILVSGVVSLSLTPLLCSRFLRPPSGEKHNRLYAASERVFQWTLDFYGRSLRGALKHRRTTMIIMVITLVATGYLFAKVPTGFLPNEDTGAIFGFTEAVQGISFDDMARHQQRIVEAIRKDPNIASVFSSTGWGPIAVESLFA
jgi:HAE1 family hydrophobic/amphiphilic exporter-1